MIGRIDVIVTMSELSNIEAICSENGIDLSAYRALRGASGTNHELEFSDGAHALISVSSNGWIKAFEEEGGRVTLSEMGFIEISGLERP